MTTVTFDFTPEQVGYRLPLNEEFVARAATRIQSKLISVSMTHDDTETREHDPRRTHTPMSDSSWLVAYKGNSLIITNEIGNNVNQMQYLKEGNGSFEIYPSRRGTPQWSKGWTNDRHRTIGQGGKRPLPGERLKDHPPMLKFWSKRDGMFMYRSHVHPISTGIIRDFNRDIEAAVKDGLTETFWDEFDFYDQAVGTNEPLNEDMEELTLEEMTYRLESVHASKSHLDNYIESKADEPLIAKTEAAEPILQQFGIVDKVVGEVKEFAGKIDKRIGSFSKKVGGILRRAR